MNKILLLLSLISFISCKPQGLEAILSQMPKETNEIIEFEKIIGSSGEELGLESTLFCDSITSLFSLQDCSRITWFEQNDGNISSPYLIKFEQPMTEASFNAPDPQSFDITTTNTELKEIIFLFGSSAQSLSETNWESAISKEEASVLYNRCKEWCITDAGMIANKDDFTGYDRYLEGILFPVCSKLSTTVESGYAFDNYEWPNKFSKAYEIALIKNAESSEKVSFSVVLRVMYNNH